MCRLIIVPVVKDVRFAIFLIPRNYRLAKCQLTDLRGGTVVQAMFLNGSELDCPEADGRKHLLTRLYRSPRI
jgi:hypothetical protein